MTECTDCGRLVPDPHAPHDCDGSEYLDPEAFKSNGAGGDDPLECFAYGIDADTIRVVARDSSGTLTNISRCHVNISGSVVAST